jgi:hypothetical protein
MLLKDRLGRSYSTSLPALLSKTQNLRAPTMRPKLKETARAKRRKGEQRATSGSFLNSFTMKGEPAAKKPITGNRA